eukprot:CAMPEP_0202698260 /NCGR_PEP_ID=MMETSP1385-20130828/11534_1 /ASSEMBLY_ACC=CAM_ASM_000861 /TAXON_ID=933848 /ORGANISM="Elphidium margaritaceum" /LENGTH=267 /DNA_ID=CAMNT_0049354925 /DNA_START=53 /DNA_END=856 /DNA_ORIENTATION=-
MFEATLEDGDVLKKLIGAIGDLVQDANFDCSDEGIRLQAMDSSHVSLVNLFLSVDSFSHFVCDAQHTLGLNLASLNKVLKCSKPKDCITLRHEDDSDTLQLIFADTDDHRTLQFDLKLLDIDQERLVIPETEYASTVKMSSKEFKSVCSDFQTIGDSLGIACTKDGIKFSLSGEIGKGHVIYRHNANIDDVNDLDKTPNTVLIRCQEPIAQNFAIRYLAFFTKATSLSKCVTLFMSADVPLVTEYRIDDIGHLKYYLAPKIDDGDQE